MLPFNKSERRIQMDIKKWVHDRINELDREKEELLEKQKQEAIKENNDIQAQHDQADILEKFIKETIKPCFEKIQENLQSPDFLCEIEPISDKQGPLYAIKIKFSLLNHDKSFYLKYEGEPGNDNVTEEFFPGCQSLPDRRGFPIDQLSCKKIEKDIEDLIKQSL